LVARTAKNSGEDRVLGLGAEVAFFSLLALPPSILAILGGVGFVAEYLGSDVVMRVRSRVLSLASNFLTPDTVAEAITPLVDNVLEAGRFDIISVGLVVALWSASRATNVTLEAVRIAYDIKQKRAIFRRRMLALGLTVSGVIVAIVILPLLVVGPRLGGMIAEPFGQSELLESILRGLYWPVAALVGISFLVTLYHLALPERTRWSHDIPGAIVAAALWIAGGSALRLYATWNIGVGTTYGSLAAPIIILLWLYATAVSVLIGAELNAEISRMWRGERPPVDDAPED
jgi:membrane protein